LINDFKRLDCHWWISVGGDAKSFTDESFVGISETRALDDDGHRRVVKRRRR
jgi:hypothetical protein